MLFVILFLLWLLIILHDGQLVDVISACGRQLCNWSVSLHNSQAFLKAHASLLHANTLACYAGLMQ